MKKDERLCSDDDEIMLESLIRSPAFSALKRLLHKYKDICYSEILTTQESNKLFQLQGRLIGLGAIENLPEVVVKQRSIRLAKEEIKRKHDEETKARLTPRKD